MAPHSVSTFGAMECNGCQSSTLRKSKNTRQDQNPLLFISESSASGMRLKRTDIAPTEYLESLDTLENDIHMLVIAPLKLNENVRMPNEL